MKQQNLLLLLFLSFAMSSFASSKTEDKTKINFLKQHYSAALVLQAVDQVLEHDGFRLSIIDKEEGYDYSHYQQRAAAMVMSHPNVLDAAFSNVSRKKEGSEIIDHVMNWCHIYTTISQLSVIKVPLYLEQVLAEISSSKVIIDSFLTADEQTWNSLSSAQLDMLPYVTANFMYKKTEVERLEFLRDFQTKVTELATNNED